jgi:predicted nuclease of predicted toxin-antitoxin system
VTIEFIVDAQLPVALAKAICAEGYKAEHVARALQLDAEDTEIWELAKRDSLVIISKDDDFAKRSKQVKAAPVVVWVRVGNIRNKALIDWFRKLLPQVIELIKQGNVLIEIR